MKENGLFNTLVQEDIAAVEELMRSQAEGFNSELQAAFNLLLSAGGKRVRPTLTLLAGRMLGSDPDRLYKLAAAIELLHSATLVHDDLIDGSLLRRGLPTLNARWGPGATVLTGDFVFARAAHMAASTESVPVMKLFSQTLSIIVAGEINQLFSSRCKADRENYQTRIYSKTASLFETACHTAAMICPTATPDQLEDLRTYGYHLGIAFQIVDDILDFTSDASALGKPVGSDFRSGIVTLPAIIFAEENPHSRIAEDLNAGRCITEPEMVNEVIRQVIASGAIEKSYLEATAHAQKAVQSIASMPDSVYKQALATMADYFLRRES